MLFPVKHYSELLFPEILYYSHLMANINVLLQKHWLKVKFQENVFLAVWKTKTILPFEFVLFPHTVQIVGHSVQLESDVMHWTKASL